MIREVDLVSYLPSFMENYREPVAALEAENPEFNLVWTAADKVLRNRFIATADEYGISRFEKMLGIYPLVGDTLESRRSRVQSKWFNTIPHTMKALISKLIVLCGDSDFEITKDFLYYRIEIDTSLELFGQVEELENIIKTMIPCNMVVESKNKISCDAEGGAFWGSGVCFVESFLLTQDEQTEHVITGNTNIGGAITGVAAYVITNDSNEDLTVNGSVNHAGGVINTVDLTITSDELSDTVTFEVIG